MPRVELGAGLLDQGISGKQELGILVGLGHVVLHTLILVVSGDVPCAV
jgi:hypothetical protein